MKKISLHLFIFFLCSINITDAQIYPYFEDFNSMTPFTNPAGWTCTVPGFQVLPTHGTTSSNGMTAQMTTLGAASDSVISPFLGPITGLSEFSFDYRIMDISLYPNFAHTLTFGEKIEFYAVSGPFSQLFATIDLTSHITTTSFSHLVFPLGALSGNSGNMVIKVTRTTSDFFADFDNFSLSDATGIAESVKISQQAIVYPNPSANGTVLQLKGVEPGKYSLKLISASGAINIEKDVIVESKENSAVNADHLASGNYMLELKSNRNNYIMRFVVKD